MHLHLDRSVYSSSPSSSSSSSNSSSPSSSSSDVPFSSSAVSTDEAAAAAGINETTSRPLIERNEDFAKVEFAVLAVILILAVAGNALVIFILASIARHKKLSRMNMMIGHLTVADIFVGFFHVLPQLAWKVTFHFRGGQFLCKFVTYVQLVAMFAASYVLVTTAVDRYLAICHPLRMHAWGRRRMRLLVVIAWVVSFVFAIPQMFIFSYVRHPKASLEDQLYDCLGDFKPKWTLSLYVTWVTLSIYLIPLVILVFLYTKICMTVWRSASLKKDSTRDREVLESPLMPSSVEHGHRRHSHHQGNSYEPRAHVRIVSQAKLKTVKLTLVVIANYVLCYGPYFVSQMWAAWDVHAPFEGYEMTIIMLLASLTSCTNPWIYVAFNDRFHVFLSTCFTHPNTRPTPSTTIDSTSYTRTTQIHCTAHRCCASTAANTNTTNTTTTTTTTITATTSPASDPAGNNTSSPTTTTTVDPGRVSPSSDEAPEVESVSRF